MINKIKLFYLFLFLLPFVSPVTTPLYFFFAGFFIIAGSYLAFYKGYHSVRNLFPRRDVNYQLVLRYYPLDILALLSPMFAIYAVDFYTGQMPLEVLINFFDGVSNYVKYQEYFSNNELSEFGIRKIPAVAALCFLKIALIGSFVRLLIYKNKSFIIKLGVILTSFSHLYISIGRGTSLEMFELFFLIYFCVPIDRRIIKFGFVKKRNILLFILAAFFVQAFIFNINVRSELGCITKDMCFDEGFLSQIFGGFSKVTYSLMGYFGFGIYYTHFAVFDYILSDFLNIISSFFPLALANSIGASGLRAVVCTTLDCGYAWQPDIVTYIYNLGWVGACIFIYFSGRFARKLESERRELFGVWSLSAQYLLFMLVITMPFGNVVTNSSSNFLSFISFIFIRYFCIVFFGRYNHG